jgi:hypothetical protein
MSESWLPVVSALIGAGVGGGIGFFGSYLIQKKTWKNKVNKHASIPMGKRD